MSPENESFPETVPDDESEESVQEVVKLRVEISRKDQEILRKGLTRFTSCGRCSLLIAAYRLYHDDAEMLAAVNEIEDGWLLLSWDKHLRTLINKSYGCRLDVEAFYFESCCPECKGTFIYREPEDGQPQPLRLKM